MDTSINPIAAEIVLPAFGLGIRLSEEGAALLRNIPDGLYLVQARHLGYRPDWRLARVRGDTARLEFVLPPAEGVDGGLAEARLRDFLRRSGRLQVASFITRAQIERRQPWSLVALLSRITEITIDRSGPGPTVIRSTRAGRADCPSGMLVFVDGMLPMVPTLADESGLPGRPVERSALGWRANRAMLGRAAAGGADASRWAGGASPRYPAGVEQGPSGGRASPRRFTSALDWVPVSLVGAVEVYPSLADVPSEFRVVGAECGVLLVWSRRR